MATSSSGRSSLGQWQRIVTLWKDYLTFGGHLKAGNTGINIAPQTAAALQAVELYLKQVRAIVQAPGTSDASQQLSGPQHSDAQQLKQAPGQDTSNDHKMSSMPPASPRMSSLASRYSQTASAPVSRAASPSVTSHIEPSGHRTKPASPSTSSIRPTIQNLKAISPTYSIMSIPIINISKPTSRSTTVSGAENIDSTSVTSVTIPESDIQRALRTVNSYIPTLPQVNLNFLRNSLPKNNSGSSKGKEAARPKWLDEKRSVVSKSSIDSRTRHLVRGATGSSDSVTLRRLVDLCHHLKTFPNTKGTAVKCGGLGRMLRVLANTSDPHVTHEARTALALMGYAGPVGARGARLLTIDGGGVRGLVAIELLQKLEAETGKSVHEMFDFICGVSTGAIVAVLVGAHRMPLSDCKTLYRDLSERIFSQTALRGATRLVINNSYYDSKAWDAILKENMGDTPLIHTAGHTAAPKLSLVASYSVRSVTKAYIFRNYVLPYRVASHYSGTCNAKLWEAVRASAAAPGYFSEFQLGDKTLLDGGLLVNNPTAIAVHEARQLWPDEGFQCVVSLGTGRHQPLDPTTEGGGGRSINWSDKLKTVINSATDTEGVHTILHDLLPGNVYFRFNPHLSDPCGLDEIRPHRIAAMMDDTQQYARQNTAKFKEAANALMLDKTHYHRARDYFKRGRLVSGLDVKG